MKNILFSKQGPRFLHIKNAQKDFFIYFLLKKYFYTVVDINLTTLKNDSHIFIIRSVD